MSDILAKQNVLQRSIERALENFKKVGKANLTPAKIRTRISALQANWTLYQDGHAHLLTAVAEPARASLAYFHENQFDATEDLYQTTWEYMTECLEEIEPVNKSLGDFARMHYLASSLKGKALNCLNNIAVTADNFPIAWRTVTARFENKRRIISSHFSSLLGLTGLARESASELQSLCDKVDIAVASLRGLDRSPSDLWNDFLVHLLSQNLDPASRKAWNLKTSDTDSPPTYAELVRFLSIRVRALEECHPTANAKSPKASTSSRVHVANASASPAATCPLCKARHYLSACSKFVGQNPSQRRDTVKKLKRCFNCLSASHAANDCKSQYTCRICQKRHHSMLYLDSNSDPTAAAPSTIVAPSAPSVTPTGEVTSLLAAARPHSRARVLLATARVRIDAGSSRTMIVRALIDQGSEATFISESLAQSLRAKRIRMPTTISVVGGVQLGTVRHAADITVSPATSSAPSFSTTALILSSLTSYAPRRVSDISTLAHLSGLSLADHDPTGSDPIHVILGADLYSSLILDGIKRGEAGQPFAQNSIFGWIISGPLESSVSSSSAHMHLTGHHCLPLSDLSSDLTRFWEVEELPPSHGSAPHDEQCEAHFRATHTRANDGRYIVRLPFKTGPPIDIGQSRQAAARLCRSLSRRFITQPTLKGEYSAFMREYEELGHMHRIPEPHDASRPPVYIPHHPVFRSDSVTSHLCVVFNASSKTSNGTSLNDHLLAGPKLQTELPAILLQWRQFRYVYSADIAK
ncbi:PREDICTED: uncharacterized protein LOC105569429, partial [Vollenhovia emeryi]|uniref:uncharacterized protein LOC105569429 n=1 Tax=Vollenhovia emeryi TaxID=411798 RepID=UPI0005F37683